MNHPYLRERRDEMLRGERHKDCSSCWALEDSEMESPREGFDSLDEFNQFSVSYGEALKPVNHSDRPYMIDLELSNLCDAKCIYCNWVFSSKWEQEDLERGKLTINEVRRLKKVQSSEFDETFWQWFEEIKPGLGYINIIGGEPFLHTSYIPTLERILESFKDVKRPREEINLVTVTNLNAPPVVIDRVLDILPRLNERFTVNIDVSMEATGARAEYIRDGVRWERWLSNLEKLLKLNLDRFEVAILGAINILSLTDLPNFFKVIDEFREKYQVRISLKRNIVTDPPHLSPYLATPELVVPIEKAGDFVLKQANPKWNSLTCAHNGYNWDRYGQFLHQLAGSISKKPMAEKKSLRADFYGWVQDHDQTRGKDFLKTFPDYRNFFEVCEREFREGRQHP
jgi:hypothetical protein